VGLGLTPEAIDTNPIMYDLVSDLYWESAPVNADDWVKNYTYSRYGQQLTGAQQAWKALQYSVYNAVNTGQEGASGSVIGARPSLTITRTGCCAPVQQFYDPEDVISAWNLLLSVASSLNGSSETYQNDLVMVSMQSLTDIVLSLYGEIVDAFNAGKSQQLQQLTTQFLDLIEDADTLLKSSEYFLLGPWIQQAQAWGTSADEVKMYESNARTQITLWGDKDSEISGYAYKLWSGLVLDFYGPRWGLFFLKLEDALRRQVPFNQAAFDTEVKNFEESWTQRTNVYPTSPVGDTLQISQALFQKYHHT